ncbi:MAG: hypothetical protein GY903_15470 [Fuerstiella sp.]|nr:hypothetical protein [Fuerstiella sp.]MCP4855881.1 hypothetical protein [Fuerstiella sp.]
MTKFTLVAEAATGFGGSCGVLELSTGFTTPFFLEAAPGCPVDRCVAQELDEQNEEARKLRSRIDEAVRAQRRFKQPETRTAEKFELLRDSASL